MIVVPSAKVEPTPFHTILGQCIGVEYCHNTVILNSLSTQPTMQSNATTLAVQHEQGDNNNIIIGVAINGVELVANEAIYVVVAIVVFLVAIVHHRTIIVNQLINIIILLPHHLIHIIILLPPLLPF